MPRPSFKGAFKGETHTFFTDMHSRVGTLTSVFVYTLGLSANRIAEGLSCSKAVRTESREGARPPSLRLLLLPLSFPVELNKNRMSSPQERGVQGGSRTALGAVGQ